MSTNNPFSPTLDVAAFAKELANGTLDSTDFVSAFSAVTGIANYIKNNSVYAS